MQEIASNYPYKSAVEELKKIVTYSSPLDKLECIGKFSGGHLDKYWGGGQGYCLGRMTSHLHCFRTRLLFSKMLGGPSPPPSQCPLLGKFHFDFLQFL